jgi:hypothetical protein
MDIGQKQLTILSRVNVHLYQQIQSGNNDVNVQLQATKTQYPTLVVQTENGYSALHHPDDPISHCREILASIPDLHEKHNIILFGCGLGYLPLMLQQSKPTFRNLFIVEPTVSVFRHALQTVDLSSLLENPHVHFIVGVENQIIYQELLPYVIELMANQPALITYPPSTNTFPQWFDEAQRQINAVIQLGRSGLATKMKDGPLTLSNLFQNLEVIQESSGIQPLENQLKGIPAVVVAAGPSLAKNIDQLKDIQDQLLIIATDTALETCLQHGITPHFVVTVDPTELNLRHFHSERYNSSITLLFDPEARPEIPAKFEHVMTYMTDKHDFFTWLDRQSGGKGVIKKGGMVSQAGLYAAAFFGCDPLVLIGQDLALDPNSGATHTAQAANVRKATFNMDEKNFVEVSTIEDASKNSREQLFWVDGVDGKPVPTMHNFLVYIHMLAEDIKQINAKVIDATEGGAKIPGSEIMALSDVIQQYVIQDHSVRQHLQECFHQPDKKSIQTKNDIKLELKKLLASRVQKAQKGREFLKNAEQISLQALERKLEEYRNGIMSNPVAEYIIEYGAPQELFEFLKLAPANATDDVKKANTIHRFESLLLAVEASAERLIEQLSASN